MQLNISGFSPYSMVNGPGTRAVVWVQGCPLACPGCFNAHTHDAERGTKVSAQEMAGHILALDGIEGVTFSGGEPFEQAAALAQLSTLLRASGLSLMSFSGYTLDEIRASGEEAKLNLLGQLDILIDGRFDMRQKAPSRWRGSANQRVHFLSSTYRHWQERVDEPLREFEVQLSHQGDILISGFLEPKDDLRWRNSLAELGLKAERVIR